jgi:hypothetical protein
VDFTGRVYLKEFSLLNERVFTVGTEKKFDYYRQT